MWSNFFDNIQLLFSDLRPQDLLDMFLVWLVLYRVLVLIRRTGAVQMLSGLGILAIAYLLSIWFEFYAFNWLLEVFFSNLFLIVVILFQGEIRRALAHIGSNPFFTGPAALEESQMVEELAKGALTLAQRGIGGLIVIEREIGLEYFIELGTEVDARVDADLLCSIFHSSSPLHDGAAIIRNGRIFATRCFLPLSKNPALDKNLGTRHRAAIGLTEETDAFVLVISEEARSVGIVQAGQLTQDVDLSQLRQELFNCFGVKYRPEKVIS